MESERPYSEVINPEYDKWKILEDLANERGSDTKRTEVGPNETDQDDEFVMIDEAEEYEDDGESEEGEYEDDEESEEEEYEDDEENEEEDDEESEEEYYEDNNDASEYEFEKIHYGNERGEISERESIISEIEIPDWILKRHEVFGSLPSSVAVMGGMARSIAREILTGEEEPIRDIDLVNIVDGDGNSSISSQELDELSRKYMPDDYNFGHGIQSDSLENYFKTRDFTINQCLIKDGKLLISDIAEQDFVENIIRPSYYELSHDQDELSGRLFLKAIILQSVISQISNSIPLLEDVNMPNPHDAAYGENDEYTKVVPFDIALFLNKAMSRGVETSMIFVNILVDWEIVSEIYIDRPMRLAKDLAMDVYNFEFRPTTDAQFQDISNGRDIDGFFIPESMSRYHSTDPVITKAIAEYGNDEDYRESNTQKSSEPVSGYYTQADYDEINGY